MRVALVVAAKDLRQRLRNRSAIVVSIIAPLGLAIIFSQLLGSAIQFHATYVVSDMDGGTLSTAFRDDVLGGLVDAGVADVSDVPNETAARAAVDDGTADAAFIVPAGFTAAIQAGQAVTLDIVGARDAGLETQVAQSVAQRFADSVVGVQLSVATAAGVASSPLSEADITRIAGQAAAAPAAVALTDQTADIRQLSLPTYYSAAMAALFLFLTAQMGLVSIFNERDRGTLRRILASPLRPLDVLWGKLLGGFLQACIAMTVLIVATTVLIKADWGPPLGVALVALAGILAATGISTLVVSFFHSGEAAGSASSAVAITLGILGGTFAPTNTAPDVMARVALLTPHAWFLRGLSEMAGPSGSVAACLPAVGVLLVMAGVTGGLGLRRARRLVSLDEPGERRMSQLGKVLAIGRVNLVRQVRDRGDLFFVFVLPTIIVVALGLQFGGSTRARLGIVAPTGDPAAEAIVAELSAEGSPFTVQRIADVDAVVDGVQHGTLEAGLAIPDGFSTALAGTATVEVRYVGTADSLVTGLRAPVEAAVAKVGAITTASRVVVADGLAGWDQANEIAAAGYDTVPGVQVSVTEAGEPGFFDGFSRFTLGATTQLIMFVFLTSVSAAGRLVMTKQLGVSRRMLATPTSAWTIVAGETLGRYLVALLQAVYIVAVSSLLFGVSWGDPLAAAAIVAVFCLVGAGAAMLVGAMAHNGDQASSMGVFAGLALGALGGCMIPFQVMPEAMQSIARLIPHSWAVLGLQQLIREGGGLASVAPNLAVLTGWAVVLLGLAAWRFRKSIAG